MTYKQYKVNGILSDNIMRILDDTVTYIPNVISNTDWIAYQAWLSDGNTPDPADG